MEKKFKKKSKEVLELALAKLLLEGYLEEDFHFTPYSIISYVVIGGKGRTFQRNSKRDSEALSCDIPSKKSKTDNGVICLD